MARKTIVVCDACGAPRDQEDSSGAKLRMTFNDARKGAREADLCDNCAGEMPGQNVARRGRKPRQPVPA